MYSHYFHINYFISSLFCFRLYNNLLSVSGCKGKNKNININELGGGFFYYSD